MSNLAEEFAKARAEMRKRVDAETEKQVIAALGTGKDLQRWLRYDTDAPLGTFTVKLAFRLIEPGALAPAPDGFDSGMLFKTSTVAVGRA